MQVSSRALVFSSLKYAEADLIVSCFTEKFGLKSYLLRGILKSKRGKLRTSMFQPLSLLQIEAYHKDKGSLERINEAKVILPYKTLHTEVVKTSLLLFLSEILKNSVKEEEANPSLFQFIENSLKWLDINEKIANFHLLFLLKLTNFLGFYPDFSENNAPYFNLMEGNFQQHSLGQFCEEGEAIVALIQLDKCEFKYLSELSIPKSVRLKTLDLLLKYYQLHIQGYKAPKSLPVLTQLFH
ncbi:DNA repair protein RecO [Aureisphaera sp. CAU 1614]|uniref:DNA repair protein RecO n=1 Tax=Halomarinibacterium sedimenti TaxID=2857106 RepID=A0A9X1K0H6_9FLAO|nr:DNA repair protein RecO [Halomarinibacterium sedimenti]MBW2938461.1 DNA repair protein RecO [Halomarinibacterium sedimenti]